MEQDFTFPIIVKKEGKEYVVRFPGLDIAEQSYDERVDYITESKKLLVEVLLQFERQNITIPTPQSINDVIAKEDESIIFLNIWLPFYRSENEKYVKKTLTIPSWIDELAKKQNLNFSQILKEALLMELGLNKDYKNLKKLKFRKPMKKVEDLLVIVYDILLKGRNNEIELINLAVNTKDINLIVTIFTIWVNKNISEFLSEFKIKNVKKDQQNLNKQDWLKIIKGFECEFKDRVDLVCANMKLVILRQDHYDQQTVDELICYCEKLAACLAQSALKYDGLYEREECIYDFMRVITSVGMLKKNIKKEYQEEYFKYYTFTYKHEIEIPYLYILVWNIRHLYLDTRNGNFDRLENIKSICRDCLKYVSSTMLEILIGNPISCSRLEAEVIATKRENEKVKPLITRVGRVDFKEVLPFIRCNQSNESEYIDMHDKIISGKVLSRLPMVPMDLSVGDRVGIKYLVDLLCRDLES